MLNRTEIKLIHATYDLRAKQQTILTPRLQQSVKLLQMSAVEFTQELRQALSSNPFLEEIPEDEIVQNASAAETAHRGDEADPAAADAVAAEPPVEPVAQVTVETYERHP